MNFLLVFDRRGYLEAAEASERKHNLRLRNELEKMLPKVNRMANE